MDFAVYPKHPGSHRIADLDRAPRDGDGLVRFDADLRVLRPTEGGSHNLMFVVPNRGLLVDVPFSQVAHGTRSATRGSTESSLLANRDRWS